MSTPFTATLEARDVACDRGGRRLFENLSFSLEPGDGLLVQGPNGTGKTSLMRQIAGLLPLSAGEVSIGGVDADIPLAEFCHYVGHLNGVKASLTVRENLSFWSRFLHGDSEWDDMETALDVFGLTEIADVAAGFLSAGQKRKLALSRLFACARPIWLLDEPSVSLDAASVEPKTTINPASCGTGLPDVYVLDIMKGAALNISCHHNYTTLILVCK